MERVIMIETDVRVYICWISMELSRGASIARRNRKFLVGVKIGIKNHGGGTHQSFALIKLLRQSAEIFFFLVT